MTEFSKLHPTTLLISYLGIMLCIFFCPSLLNNFIFILSGAIYLLKKYDGKKVLSKILPLFFLTVFFAIINPFLTEGGKTLLFVSFGKRIYLERITEGAVSGGCLSSLLLWIEIFADDFGTDKMLLFTRKRFPKISLILAISLRFIPNFLKRFAKYRDYSAFFAKNGKNRIKKAVESFSNVLSVSTEDAVTVAQNLDLSGFDNKNISVYSDFVFTFRDLLFIISFSLLTIFSLSVSFVFIKSGNEMPFGKPVLTVMLAIIFFMPTFPTKKGAKNA